MLFWRSEEAPVRLTFGGFQRVCLPSRTLARTVGDRAEIRSRLKVYATPRVGAGGYFVQHEGAVERWLPPHLRSATRIRPPIVPVMRMLDRVVKADADRDHWEFVPFERIGLPVFGMPSDETASALGLSPRTRLHGSGSHRTAPDGFALVGRLPSVVRPWVHAQVEKLGTDCVLNEWLDVAIEEIGLVLRVHARGTAARSGCCSSG